MTVDLRQAAFELACEDWAREHPDCGSGLETVNLSPLPEGASWWDITQARGRLAIKAQRQRLGTAAYQAAMRSFQDQAIRPEPTPTESLVVAESAECAPPAPEDPWPFYAPVWSWDFWICFTIWLVGWAVIALAAVGTHALLKGTP